jgi:glyoxylase-like metal-dependent hydrolase (beta-lactamase superfamily II)
MKLYSIPTGNFKLDGGAMFGVVPKSIWNKLNPADENNLCNWAMRCLLIVDGNKKILIDNGIGNKQDSKFLGHYFLNGPDNLDKSLNSLGLTKQDITDVILTHLHFDHCGGSIERINGELKTSFPNAVYWSNETHWKWATQPNEREKASFLKENILPIQDSGQLQFIQGGQRGPIADGYTKLEQVSSPIHTDLSFFFVHGHTAAMMLPVIRYGHDKTLVYMADLLPAAAHIPLPYVMGYDMFPLTSLYEKKSFLDEALKENYILFFEHDLNNECCSLQATEKGVRPAEYFTLESFVAG